MHHHSNCPVVKREVLTVYRMVEFTGVYQPISGEIDVCWLRECEVEIELQHRGTLVKRCCTLCDYYGFMTSATSGVPREINDFRKAFNIHRGDQLEVVANAVIRDMPMVHIPQAEFAGREAYRHLASEAVWLDKERTTRLEEIEVDRRFPLATSNTIEVNEIPQDSFRWAAEHLETAKRLAAEVANQ